MERAPDSRCGSGPEVSRVLGRSAWGGSAPRHSRVSWSPCCRRGFWATMAVLLACSVKNQDNRHPSTPPKSQAPSYTVLVRGTGNLLYLGPAEVSLLSSTRHQYQGVMRLSLVSCSDVKVLLILDSEADCRDGLGAAEGYPSFASFARD